MELKEKQEAAVALKHSGWNCCQSVLLALGDGLELPEDTLKQLGAAFCVGMGGMDGDCGALIAAEMALGLRSYRGAPIIRDAKKLFNAFRSRAGATVCRELKGVDSGTVLCSCEDCVRHAIAALEELCPAE